MSAKTFFTAEEQRRIVEAIAQAEMSTSGEIRVHLEKKCNLEVLDRASQVFAKLNMHKTAERNGVLFYLAVENRKFAILGDAGINAKTGSDFWNEIKADVVQDFSSGNIADGLVNGILKAGEQLKAHFPYQSDDVNELPNEISFK
ncbi:TPM domain-containing protein [Williamwhitmania taraxaci]|uniref:TLP18.3, Psb32 and MOLO-1 founding protein of phosphatase n=1 Tax=Williamwhitmania taraxaci TaxID=1640674 RepID=A0A1G6GU65_9BACT|nr:TPM domain-containing protein [Williamwhitmania taraxaci]SDB84666.1 TLP18.3, Psb32 and MOLO-1 founding protein of phosphatase [Williamwhitmania taraxaci]